MNRLFHRLLISTGLSVAVLALLAPTSGGAQELDSVNCMQDVGRLRADATQQGGPTTIDAWAGAAEEACRAGDYGLASAYIADAERRIVLRDAQRDESGATAARSEGTPGATGGAAASFGAGATAAAGGDGDGDDSFAENAGDEISDTAKDVGDEIEDAANDVGDAISDAFD
jgi:hypothetical protein